MCRPSRDSPHFLSLPGTAVPGYRLFRPYGTALSRPVNDTAIAGFSSLHESSVLEGTASARMCRPSRDSPHLLSLPGTAVPGYRLFRPRSTSSGQALRDCFVAARKMTETGQDGQGLKPYIFSIVFGTTQVVP
jgi:hypothetical protein